MANTFRWGVLGPGNIARKFATDIQRVDGATLLAVGSRSLDRARAFADAHGAERAYGSYEELVADPDVDAIYVSTPHPFHREHTLLCLERDKPVLCEKPMAINARQAAEMISYARQKGVFLMEAMWTRFLPVLRKVSEWIAEGRIGDVRLVSADFGFRTRWNPEARLLNPHLAGGAVLDVGVYVVAFASMVYGRPPARIQASAYLGETGVDEQTAMLFAYDDGALAQLSCAIRTSSPQEAWILGTEGRIHVPAFWHATSATLERSGEDPVQATGDAGFQFEIEEATACIQAGRTESAFMPLDESLSIAETLEQVRTAIGLTYPIE